ncbi:MAG: VWA domain-containing protein [Chloroflexota bacterium]|nr:VWA domain-containing protein [Chloroflexota bacterium]
MTERRLPVYLLLDCSESMAGEAIEAVIAGVNTLIARLKTNPLAVETTYVSVITFAREARQLVPLTEVSSFELPKLSVRTGTSLGSVLKALMQSIRQDVASTSSIQKGDYRPLVFLLTDGQPTDEWESIAKELKRVKPRIANIYAIGCGPDVDVAVLREVSDIVLLMKDLSPDSFHKLFIWLSASVQSVSASPFGTNADDWPILPNPPYDVLEFPSQAEAREPRPRQVFLHARCIGTRRPYLMRFALNPAEGLYYAVAAHPLEMIEPGDSNLLPPINSASLRGCPSCPYCLNPMAALCPCGSLLCSPSNAEDLIVCPDCNSTLAYGSRTNFDIKRSQG